MLFYTCFYVKICGRDSAGVPPKKVIKAIKEHRLTPPSDGLLGGWLAGWRAGWLAGWVAGWLAGWLAGGLAGVSRKLEGGKREERGRRRGCQQ